jgi:hypothetical protein
MGSPPMSYITTYARPFGLFDDFTCTDPNATKYATKDKWGCFCNTGYACTQPEDPSWGCEGDCLAVLQEPSVQPGSLAEQVCREAGLTWDSATGKCLQGGVTPLPTPGPAPGPLPGGGGGGSAPLPQPGPVPLPQKASMATQDLWLAVIVGGLVIGMIMMSKPAPRRVQR